jgi:hypothetical protein
VEGQINAS